MRDDVLCCDVSKRHLNLPTMILSVLIALLAIIIQPGCAAQPVDDIAETSNAGEERTVAEEDAIPSVASSNANEGKRPRIALLGFEDVLNLKRSDILGLGNNFPYGDDGDIPPRLKYDELHADDMVEDSFFDPLAPDPSCAEEGNEAECWHPPDSTVEEELVEVCDDEASAGLETLAWGYGGADPDDGIQEEGSEQQEEGSSPEIETGGEEKEDKSADKGAEANAQCAAPKTKYVDKHWGGDLDILQMRDRLRGRRGKYWDEMQKEKESVKGNATEVNATEAEASPDSEGQKKDDPPRPPVFLLPGLASTRLVSWKHKPCPQNPLLPDVKMLDYVWLNMNLLLQMATIDARCWSECMTLGKYQTDYDGVDDHGCKLRPDEGLDSISSLAPGSISSNLFVGGTNTVYAWLIQWLADNLGYDVTSIVALPYDWRLSPDKMEARDGFLTMTRKKIEAAVESNGRPGIVVAHSMGNSVFRYFLEWLRVQMREDAYNRYVEQAQHTLEDVRAGGGGRGPFWRGRALYRGARTLIAGDGNAAMNVSDASLLDELTEDAKSDNQSGDRENIDSEDGKRYPKLYDLAKIEGDAEWIEWQQRHIWTYVGLSAPLLGAPGPLRSVLSGENMGLPFTHEEARGLELSFGSTSTVNPISTKMGFCDGDDMGAGKMSRRRAKGRKQKANLACLEELVKGIESSSKGNTDPWKEFPALRLLLKDRVDFDSVFSTIGVEREYCYEKEASPCQNRTTVDFGPKDVMSGRIFDKFSRIWREDGDPLGVKLDQLSNAWWHTDVPNILESTPERPHIKHVIMAYGTDISTEVGYVYRKRDDLEGNSTAMNAISSGKKEKRAEFDGVPEMAEVIWEERHGKLVAESQISEPTSLKETLLLKKKKPKRRALTMDNGEAPSWLHHSGDGTIPYISLMWAHTWLLHATRAMRSLNMTNWKEGERISNPNNALDAIKVSHRPKGGNEWLEGYGADPRGDEDSEQSDVDADTGTSHPHGTKYKPKMVRFQSRGKSRSTGMTYTTTVIEAIGVEHKETTRNYDILAAAFSDVLKFLHIEDQL